MSERPYQPRGGHRGGSGGGRGGPHRGGGGGGNRGGGRGGHQNQQGQQHQGGSGEQTERPKKENILDLKKYMDKRITVKFNGGREGRLFSNLGKWLSRC